MNASLFSSERMDWPTPVEFFAGVQSEFNLEVDVCATPNNAKLPRFFSPEVDGLAQDWAGLRCWMNPPYGRDIRLWVAKAHAESKRGALVVALLPARTDTAWWHDHVQGVAEVRFIRGRIKFEGARSSAPFPSALVIWRQT